MHNHPLDPATLCERLYTSHGQQFWRSLEELAETPEGQALVQREFPEYAAQWHDPVSRRRFLHLMGASLALAGLGACTRQPEEKIVPYVQAPEGMVPGQPLFFATAMPWQRWCSRAVGRKPHGPADQGGGESAAPRESWRYGRLCPGLGAVAVRSRPLAGGE